MAYMTADDLRERVPALADTSIEDEWLEDLVEEFEDIAERYLGVAYEERTETETFDLCRSSIVVLKWAQVSEISAITVDDTAVDSDAYSFTDAYSLRFPWPQSGVLSVSYTHGFAAPTKPILRACREYVRACALADRSRVPRDAYASDVEGVTYRLSTPDFGAGRPTGFIEVDRLLNSVTSYRVPGVA